MERNLYAMQTPASKVVHVYGKFDTAGAAANGDGIVGDILSATRTGVGLYTVLLKANCQVPHVAGSNSWSDQVLDAHAEVIAGTGKRATVETITNSGGRVTGMTIIVRDLATGLAVESDNVVVLVKMVLRNTLITQR